VGTQLKTGKRSKSILATSLAGIATVPNEVAMITQPSKVIAKTRMTTTGFQRFKTPPQRRSV